IIAQRALAVVVPEGSTAGLMGAGCSLLGAGIVLRRRRKA
ncbi:MAG: PEP-CTERM sorting domain-containing protein, partial [Fibrella sp.]|nr:PEP-CTERM sorting domain-containing protein [Armatimonadota bacterium]